MISFRGVNCSIICQRNVIQIINWKRITIGEYYSRSAMALILVVLLNSWISYRHKFKNMYSNVYWRHNNHRNLIKVLSDRDKQIIITNWPWRIRAWNVIHFFLMRHLILLSYNTFRCHMMLQFTPRKENINVNNILKFEANSISLF